MEEDDFAPLLKKEDKDFLEPKKKKRPLKRNHSSPSVVGGGLKKNDPFSKECLNLALLYKIVVTQEKLKTPEKLPIGFRRHSV